MAGFIYTKSDKKANNLSFKAPLENFRNEVEKSINDIFVSFAPRKKISGEAHEQTIYSPKTFKGNSKKSKPSSLTGGSIIRNVKLNNGTQIAPNGSMPRIDIFQNEKTKKFYIVPIYVADFVKDKLPNKAIVQSQAKDTTPRDWIEMDKQYRFIFSIYKNELIEIKTKKIQNKIQGYFVSAHSSTGNITIKSHNNKELNGFKIKNNVSCKTLGIQTALYIKKYQVSPLGDINEIKSEKRIGTKKETK